MKILKSKTTFIISSCSILLIGLLLGLCIPASLIVSVPMGGSSIDVSALIVEPFLSVFGGNSYASVVIETFRNGFSQGISSVTQFSTPLTLAFDYLTFIGLILPVVAVIFASIFNKNKVVISLASILTLAGGILCFFQGEMFNSLNLETYIAQGQLDGALGSIIDGTWSYQGIGGIVAGVIFIVLAIVILSRVFLIKKENKEAK